MSTTDVSIVDVRTALAGDDRLAGRALCDAWTGAVDSWLCSLLDRTVDELLGGRQQGVALVAVGGYGRGELSLQSDIDLLLLHNGKHQIGPVADRVWYPIWDAGLKLGHSVRTVRQALVLAADDLDTATGLLQARHLAGDAELTADLTRRAEAQWRKRAKRWLATMARNVRKRHAAAGEVAFLIEPDLKEGRGGLRDVHALRWAQAARSILWDTDHAALDAAYDTLLGVRVELHRRTGRPGDQLLLQEQDGVAESLGYADADALMRAVSQAARTIAWTGDDAWHRIESSLVGPLGRARRPRDLGGGLRLQDGEVVVSDATDVTTDPALPLRAARAAADNGVHVGRASLERLAADAPAPGEVWSDGTRTAFVDLLLAGPAAIVLLEALDQQGLWDRYVPEWSAVRSKPQRNAYHRFNVDRHLWETAVGAAVLADRVDRPDLLVLAALFHDIGKGYPGDHTDVGVEMLAKIGPRMGLDGTETDALVALCRHHLLLADVATRRDLDDPATIEGVARAVADRQVLGLLGALTEADSLATGSAAWSDWKAGLVRTLVTRVDHVLAGGQAAEVSGTFPTEAQRSLVAEHRQQLVPEDDTLTVVAPDRPRLFNKVAGVLALHGLGVLDASIDSDDGWALEVFRVEPVLTTADGRGRHDIRWDRVVADLELALSGRLAIGPRLAERVRTYGTRGTPLAAQTSEPEVRVDLDASPLSTVVEVHAPDGLGVLYRITGALADLDLDLVSAKVQTLGAVVVDSFYVRSADGAKVTDPAILAEIERNLLHCFDSPS